jgi:hypothetical protein
MNAWSAVSSVVQDLLNGHLERARAAAVEEAKRKTEEVQNRTDREVAIEMQKAKDGLLTLQGEKVETSTSPANTKKNGEKKRQLRRQV